MIQFFAVVCLLFVTVGADDVANMINVTDSNNPLLYNVTLSNEINTVEAILIPQLVSIQAEASQGLTDQLSGTAQDGEASASEASQVLPDQLSETAQESEAPASDDSQVLTDPFSETVQDSEASASDDSQINNDPEAENEECREQHKEKIQAENVIEEDSESEIEVVIINELEIRSE
jgi:hypothetical protein